MKTIPNGTRIFAAGLGRPSEEVEPTPGRRRCQAQIWVRDTYRVARGTKSGFAMHYNREQCRRPAADGSDLCAQHRRIEAESYVLRCSWAEPTIDPTLKPRKGKR